MFKHKCGDGNHKFEARYNSAMPPNALDFTYAGRNFQRFLENIKNKTYIHDICKKCGKIITKETKNG